MKKSITNRALVVSLMASAPAAYIAEARAELASRREQGALSVELVLVCLGLVALAAVVFAALGPWVSSKLAGLG